MKNKVMNAFFGLQLFADPAPADPKTTDPKPDEPIQKEPEPKYTDADVDRLINQKFAEWQTKQQKAVDEAKKLAEMNAQQKAEYERDQLKKQLEELQNKETLNEMTKTARKMLADEEIVISDELLLNLVSIDAEKTKESVDSFAKLFKAAVQTAVKNALKGDIPKKGTTPEAITKDDILKIADRTERQRMMAEHKELFQ